MNIKFLLVFFSLPFFACGMDPSGLSSKRSHVLVLNRRSPHLIVRSRRGAKIQRLSGAGLNPNRDCTNEVGVKRRRNGCCSEVYPLSKDAVAPLSRVMRRLKRLSRPTLFRYSTYRSALPVCASVREDAGGFLWCRRGFVRNAFLVVVVFAE